MPDIPFGFLAAVLILIVLAVLGWHFTRPRKNSDTGAGSSGKPFDPSDERWH